MCVKVVFTVVQEMHVQCTPAHAFHKSAHTLIILLVYSTPIHIHTHSARALHLSSFHLSPFLYASQSARVCVRMCPKEKRPLNFMPVEYEDDVDNKKYVVSYFIFCCPFVRKR